MSEDMLLGMKKRQLIDPNVELFLEFEGPYGSTNFLDSSNYRKTVQVVGSPRIDTVLSKFGSSSCYCGSNSGSTSSALLVPNGIVGGLGNKDFCAEIWALWADGSGYEAVFHLGAGGTSQYSGILLSRGGVFAANAAGNSWGLFSSPGMTDPIMNQGVFAHLALVRRNGMFRLFHRGKKQGADVTPGYNPFSYDPEMVMVANQATSGGFAGYLDNFKLTVNDYKYWDDFDPNDLTE